MSQKSQIYPPERVGGWTFIFYPPEHFQVPGTCKKTCLLVEQEDMSSCLTRRHVFLLNEKTGLLIEQEDMSPGTRYSVPGTGYLVSGTRHLVPDTRYLLPVPRIRSIHPPEIEGRRTSKIYPP